MTTAQAKEVKLRAERAVQKFQNRLKTAKLLSDSGTTIKADMLQWARRIGQTQAAVRELNYEPSTLFETSFRTCKAGMTTDTITSAS